jgi:phosphatidylinositol alpha-1,6-mannosyltransferase
MPRALPRVLVLTPDFPPDFGGIQHVMHRLVEHWERVEAKVVTLEARRSSSAANAASFSIRRVRRPRRAGQASAVAVLNAWAVAESVRFRPAVVMSGHINVSPAALAARQLFGTPYVQYLHAAEMVVRRRLTRIGLRGAVAIVAVSAFTETLARQFGATAPIHRIAPGVDLPERGEPLRSGSAPEPAVLCIARLEDRYKGHDVLLRAVPLIRARVPLLRVTIVGDGPLRPLYESLARSLGVDGTVRFAGAVSDSERDELLARAQVFALPSRVTAEGAGEGFGIVFLEAAARGVPAVAGNRGGAVDAVVDGSTGILVDASNHVAVADAISELLLDPDRARTLGDAAARRAREFAWPVIARRVEDVVLDVARNR